MKIPVIDTGCGEIAFWYESDKLPPGAPLLSKFAEAPDGTPIEPYAKTVCGSCGKPWKRLEPQR